MNNSIQKSRAFFQFFCVVNVRVVCTRTARVVMLGLCCSTMAEGKPNYGWGFQGWFLYIFLQITGELWLLQKSSVDYYVKKSWIIYIMTWLENSARPKQAKGSSSLYLLKKANRSSTIIQLQKKSVKSMVTVCRMTFLQSILPWKIQWHDSSKIDEVIVQKINI